MLNQSVLRAGDSGRGSAMLAIAVIAVLTFGVPVVHHLSPVGLLCQPDIQCETDSSIYVYDAKLYVLYFVIIHLVVNICMFLC